MLTSHFLTFRAIVKFTKVIQWCKCGAFGVKENQQVIDIQLLADFLK